MKNKANIIAHTHWDAEWYFTTEDTDVLLVNNVIDAKNKLKKLNYPFIFDGQSYPMQKYLTIHDDKEVVEMIENQKIIIGPWYTQSNARQILGETYYRNLEHGINLAKGMGGSTKHALMSDIFGFADQVPQVLSKNGVETAIFMRGLDIKKTQGNNEFNWFAPDGSKIFAKVPQGGYGNAKFLGKDNKIEQKFIDIKNKDIENSISKVSLLLNGGDQMYLRDNIEKVVSQKKDKDTTWEVTSLEGYIANVRKALRGKKLSEYIGEIVDPVEQRIHLTAYSQRQDINNLIANLEYMLIKEVEPLNVLYKKSTNKDFSKLIYKSWESLFLSVAHDAAAGCNSDETNEAILQRLNAANQSLGSIVNIIQRELTSKLKEDVLRIFNTNFIKQDIVVNTKISTRQKFFELKIDKKNIDFIIKKTEKLSEGKRIEVTPQGEKEILLGEYYLHDVTLRVKGAKPLSFIDIDILESKKSIHKKVKCGISKDIFLRMEANDGDSYDFSPDSIEFKKDFKLQFNGIQGIEKDGFQFFKQEIQLNVFKDWLSREAKVKQTFSFEITKSPSGRYDVTLVTNNKMNNTRVSLLLKNDEKITSAKSNTMYFEKKYTNKKIPANWEKLYREKPVNVFPFIGFVRAGKWNFAARALREYSFDNKELQISLFRSNGVLGKDNIAWRPGRASGVNDIEVMTPDAQMQKEIRIDFSLLPKASREDANEYLTNIISYQSNQMAKHIERLQRFFLPEIKYRNVSIDVSLPKGIEVQSFYIWDNKRYARLLNVSGKQLSKQKILIDKKEMEINFKIWEIQTIIF